VESLNTVRLLLVACLLLFMVGCGGSDSRGVERTDPAVWARNVCTSLLGWRNFEGPSTDLRRRIQESKSPVEARSAIVAYWGDLLARTDDLLRDLDEAGFPSVDGGAKFAQALRGAILIMRTGFARARERASRLPVDPFDRETFLEMNERAAESVDTAGERLDRYLGRMGEGLNTPELDRIWRRTSECKSVR
jgi:hypothetical protein